MVEQSDPTTTPYYVILQTAEEVREMFMALEYTGTAVLGPGLSHLPLSALLLYVLTYKNYLISYNPLTGVVDANRPAALHRSPGSGVHQGLQEFRDSTGLLLQGGYNDG
jgi:hypothetical protein